MFGKSEWFISFDSREVKGTRSTSEMQSWNLLQKDRECLKKLSIRSMEAMGYKARKDKKKP
jgi:hypothetical protein